MSDLTPTAVFMAYRGRSGPTGGPGGLLYVLEDILGSEPGGFKAVYAYEPAQSGFSPWKEKIVDAIDFLFRLSRRYIYNVVWALRLIRVHGRKQTLYIVLEPWSAAVLALMRCRYLLIYNQQGALVAEKLSAWNALSRRERFWENVFEYFAFRGAECVYFSSEGARDAFVESTRWLTSSSFRHEVMYGNTIIPGASSMLEEDRRLLERVPEDKDIFVSVAPYSWAKGLDQIPAFLARYREVSPRNFHWIIVGSGKGREKIEALLHQHHIIDIAEIWHFDRSAHALVLSLLERADVFINFHRRSIFDFATLEAMRAGCALVLSDVSGNRDFNVSDNVLLVNPEEQAGAISRLAGLEYSRAGELNRQVFERQFSPAPTRLRYLNILREHMPRPR